MRLHDYRSADGDDYSSDDIKERFDRLHDEMDSANSELVSELNGTKINNRTNTFILRDGKLQCGYCESFSIKNKNNHLLVCTKCRLSEEIACGDSVESDETADSKNIKKQSPYQKKSHFDTLMMHSEMKRSYKVPQKVLNAVKKYINKSMIDSRSITPRDIIDILKILKLNKYYIHYIYIYSRITGKSIPNYTEKNKAKIYMMFNLITKTWTKVIPIERSNFLNYKYTMRKILEILGLTEFYIFFPYPKNDDKLIELDYFWSLICQYNGPPLIFKLSERILRTDHGFF